MSTIYSNEKGILYYAVCASPPAQQAQDFVQLAKGAGWDVCVLATPQATKFINIPVLEQLSGHPVRSEYKMVGTADVWPKVTAMAIAPMTLNTTTKWAQGNADNLLLSQLCKGLGLGLPIVAAPCITGPYSRHPAFGRSLTLLRECGVHILYDPDNYPAPKIVPWEQILERLNQAAE